MELTQITKIIDKVHDGEMSKEQAFNKIEQVVTKYWKELDTATTGDEVNDIEQEIFYLFDLKNGILAGQADGDETQVDEDIEKLCKQINTTYETMEDKHNGQEPYDYSQNN